MYAPILRPLVLVVLAIITSTTIQLHHRRRRRPLLMLPLTRPSNRHGPPASASSFSLPSHPPHTRHHHYNNMVPSIIQQPQKHSTYAPILPFSAHVLLAHGIFTSHHALPTLLAPANAFPKPSSQTHSSLTMLRGVNEHRKRDVQLPRRSGQQQQYDDSLCKPRPVLYPVLGEG